MRERETERGSEREEERERGREREREMERGREREREMERREREREMASQWLLLSWLRILLPRVTSFLCAQRHWFTNSCHGNMLLFFLMLRNGLLPRS